eukprot:5246374-Alexandrium_andersonii.AAC.1
MESAEECLKRPPACCRRPFQALFGAFPTLFGAFQRLLRRPSLAPLIGRDFGHLAWLGAGRVLKTTGLHRAWD